jgi:LPXTG-site transpeptidase (sortase) family protein
MATTSATQSHWNRLALTFLVVGVAALIGSGLLAMRSFTDIFGKHGYSGPGTATTFGNTLDIEGLFHPTPEVPPSDAPIARIAIPEFGVDAPVVIRSVDANGIMQTPDGPSEVAWYDFSGRPGFGSNAVFSGHVDYINHGPAVFWHLKDLEQGDVVEVRLEDGTVYQYTVEGRTTVSATPTQEELNLILGATQGDVITLITCGGGFDGVQYDSRVIVRAQRMTGAPGQAAGLPSS